VGLKWCINLWKWQGGNRISEKIDDSIEIQLYDVDYRVSELGEIQTDIVDLAMLENQILLQNMCNATDAWGASHPGLDESTSIESGHEKLIEARANFNEKYGVSDWREVAMHLGYGYVLGLETGDEKCCKCGNQTNHEKKHYAILTYIPTEKLWYCPKCN